MDNLGNVIQYAYDANGNLITLTYPGGRQVHYNYDAADRLVEVTDWAGRVTAYEYDPNGRLVRTAYPNGASATYDYNEAGRLIQMKDEDDSGNIISKYNYTYDPSGNIIEEINYNENVPFTMNGAVLTYAADNRLATYNGQTVVYDADGNMTCGPLAGDMSNFTYDARGRLIGAGNTTYTHDAGNNRTGVREGIQQTGYLVNPNASLSQVLVQASNQSGQMYYVYGLGLIGQESPGGVYRTYHFDLRGSTVALTNEAGQVTDRFQYAPYGEMVYRSGNTATPFLFSGRYGVMTDESDLYYMRARYYNPVAKRFLSPDPLTGQVSNPQSQNLYTYCEGKPVNYVDPMGHNEIAGFMEEYNPIYDRFNFIESWDFFKPNEVDAVWVQIGGPAGAQTGFTGYVIGRTFGKNASKKIVGKITSKYINSAGKSYPNIVSMRTRKEIPFPEGKLQRIPIEQRVEWDKGKRADYISEWYKRGYQTPEGGWSEYDIHHIKPREFGGDNSFENLIPIKRDVHIEFNEFWRNYP